MEEKNPSDRIAVQQNQEAIVAENQFNQFTKEFTERTHQLTAREQSDDFETQRFILDECNIILGREIPEILNKNWQLLSNRQSKLEILRQHKFFFQIGRSLSIVVKETFIQNAKRATASTQQRSGNPKVKSICRPRTQLQHNDVRR